MTRTITIGTRGSKLALIQTQLVAAALTELAGVTTDITTITTKGDVNQTPIPASTVGKAWFTAEIATALTSGKIDLAVHSLKDLPPEENKELITIAVLQRANPHDVLVSVHGHTLKELPKGAIVGTDSIRRKACLLRLRPDLRIKSIRGNVDTRLRKLHEEEYDAIVIAAAGLERLGMLDEVASEIFSPADCVPAPGQGVLAVQVRKSDAVLVKQMHLLQKEVVTLAVEAEQAFTRIVGGGCTQPVGCYAQVDGSKVTLYGLVGSADATKAEYAEAQGEATEAIPLVEQLATQIMHKLR